MAGFITTTNAPAIRVAEDKTFTFQKLKRKHLGEMVAKWKAKEQAEFIANSKELGLSPAEAIEKLDEHKDAWSMVSYWNRSILMSHERMMEVILASLKIANPNTTEQEVDDLPFSEEEMHELAFEIWWGQPLPHDVDPEPADEKKTQSQTT